MKRLGSKKIKILLQIIALAAAVYCFVVFLDIPFISGPRDIWIETAMTTADHQWLAEWFFPGWLIDRVMSGQVVTGEDTISNPDLVFKGRPASQNSGGALYADGADGADADNGDSSGGAVNGNSSQATGGRSVVAWGQSGASNGVSGATGGDNGGGAGNGTADGAAGDRQDGSGTAGGQAGTASGQTVPNACNTGSADGGGAAAATRLREIPKGSRGWFLQEEITQPEYTGSAYANPNGADGYVFPGMSFFNVPEFDVPLTVAALPYVGDSDEFGNKVIISDRKEEIVVVEIKKTGYTGRIMFIPDPSRVIVRHTSKKSVQGEFIKSFLDRYDAIAGMNGNGFDDPDGKGRGGSIIGWSVSDGNEWGEGAKSTYASVGFNDQNVLMVGAFKDFKSHNIRDLAQYGPTLIVDGKKLINGSGGWGVQPRSAIGQRDDGVILMATFDGRQPGHSLGITAGEIADIFSAYGCVNAGLCDGGSSSIMMYDGEIVGKPSTPMKDTGRYLPNAFLILSKESSESSDPSDNA